MGAALSRFSPPVRAWFEGAFPSPTPVQEEAWEAVLNGEHVLVHAPTGSGKTLAAFLWALDRLHTEEPAEDLSRCRVLYISPLKALAYDIDRNLRSPLRGIANAAESLGTPVPEISVAMRTGDTPAAERRQMVRHPPDILITTPESLYLMLTSAARSVLETVRWVIVDEIHSVAGTKRGSHLALSLERLEEITATPPQRIGLSATQRPLERIAAFLGGGTPKAEGWEPRAVRIVDVPGARGLEVSIVVPVDDMTDPGGIDGEGRPIRSVWPSIYPEILDLVRANRSTIVFSNSRGIVERLAAALNELAGEEIARAHHGSVSREQRVQIEDALKNGDLKCVVATSSLELGIDMEAVDLVVLVESPTTVARGLQRVGRSGHRIGVPSRARVFPKHRGDLLEAALVVDRMRKGLVEETSVPGNPLDVLAQQVVAATAVEDRGVDGLYEMVRRSAPYRDLAREPFEAVLDMLSGRYPSDDFAELRARLTWDRANDVLSARNNARLLAVTNAGTIPDRGLYPMVVPDGGKVGELDEEMVYESRVGDVVVLGSTSWRLLEITPDRVVAEPAPGAPSGRMPFWHGDRLGRPVETGAALGAFVRELGELAPDEAKSLLVSRYALDEKAAGNLAAYIEEEQEATGALPTDRSIVVQRFKDEIGDWRLVVLSPFGARVHAPWALAIQAVMASEGRSIDAVWSDDGIIVRFPDADAAPDPMAAAIDPDDAEHLVLSEVGDSPLFAGRFREAAARSLLLPRRRPGRRTPLWLQRRRSSSLLEAARRFPDFPVVLEAYREVILEHFDLPALVRILGDLRSRAVRLVTIDTPGPSPFARSLTFDFVASFMYEYDAPTAERRAMALTVDQALLAQILGEPSLREFLDPDAVSAVEADLQRLGSHPAPAEPEALLDMLRDLGPMTTDAISRRTDGDPRDALAALEGQREAMRITLRGEEHWAAMEDAARLRDGLGAVPPPGVAQAHLEPVKDPLGDLVGRYARTHGPFTVTEAASALGLPPGAIRPALKELLGRGKVSRGSFRPGGEGEEWVATEVLQRMRRRSLAVLRRQAEPVSPEDYAAFSLAWHGMRAGGARLTDTIGRLQGAAVPASILESEILPGRGEYSPDALDVLTASGEVVWVGRGPLGGRDGRIALFRRDAVPCLMWEFDAERPSSPVHEAIRSHLADRGASFFKDLRSAAGGDVEEVLDALWDLVWAGEVTNDTLAPLRAFLWGRVRSRRGGRPRLPTAAPASGSGRWYATADLLSPITATERQAAVAEQLLERHGILTRDAVLAEGVPGGFAGLYPVLSRFEDTGRARRGYFVEGLGGSQFALPGAVDRLRGPSRPVRATILAAADPANPYGAVLPWPDHDGRPSRRAGAHVVIMGGTLAAFADRGGRTVLTFGDDESLVAATAEALLELAERGTRRPVIATIDGSPAGETPLGRVLLAGSFVESYKGLTVGRRLRDG